MGDSKKPVKLSSLILLIFVRKTYDLSYELINPLLNLLFMPPQIILFYITKLSKLAYKSVFLFFFVFFVFCFGSKKCYTSFLTPYKFYHKTSNNFCSNIKVTLA